MRVSDPFDFIEFAPKRERSTLYRLARCVLLVIASAVVCCWIAS